MRVSVLQENLAKALGVVQGITGDRYLLPILENVCLTAENGRLELSATDLDLYVSVWVGAKVEQDGAFTVPATVLHKLVKNLPSERIDLELNQRERSLNVRCRATSTDLKGMNADEFPSVRDIKNPRSFIASGSVLQEMINEVIETASKDGTRPVLTGIYFRVEQDTLTLASADGYRLTVRTEKLSSARDDSITMIVPARAMALVSKLIGKGKKVTPYVYMNMDAQQVVFNFGDFQITSNLIEGTFPQYERIVPATMDTATIVYRDELLSACKRSQIFSDSIHLNAVVAKDGGVGELHLNAASSDLGTQSNVVGAGTTGDAKTALNVRYLIDALESFKEEQVLIRISDTGDPVMVHAVGRENLYYLLMPLQLGQ